MRAEKAGWRNRYLGLVELYVVVYYEERVFLNTFVDQYKKARQSALGKLSHPIRFLLAYLYLFILFLE